MSQVFINICIVASVVGIALLIIIGYLSLQFSKIKKRVNSLEKVRSDAKLACSEDPVSREELFDPFLVDFRPDRWINYDGVGHYAGVPTTPVQAGNAENLAISGGAPLPGQIISNVTRVPVRPVEVLDELKVPPTNWSLQGLDQKIEMLKKKSAHIIQRYAKQEVDGLIHCLECRKKFNEKITVDILTKDGVGQQEVVARKYFEKYDTTSDAKVQEVIGKHHLQMGDPDLFIPELPDDAIQSMDEFTSAVKAVSGKKPRYYIIAQPADFQKKAEGRDPILIGQSPFGFFYYIIGAWDAEMLYLPEL